MATPEGEAILEEVRMHFASATAEVERLQAENERLRAALKEVRSLLVSPHAQGTIGHLIAIADRALEQSGVSDG